jgi:hypothetical protein
MLTEMLVSLALCILAAGVVESGRLIPVRRGHVVRGPVRGYARAPGALFRRSDLDRLLASPPRWAPFTLETHHRRGRPRVALRIVTDQETPLDRETMLLFARALQKSSGAAAARVEQLVGAADVDDGRPGIAWSIFAPDGRGWTGVEPDTVALGRDPAGTWRRAAVAGAPDLPAAGWLAPALNELERVCGHSATDL